MDEKPLPFFIYVLYNKNTLILNFSQCMGVCVACSSVTSDDQMVDDLCPSCADESGLAADESSQDDGQMGDDFTDDFADDGLDE